MAVGPSISRRFVGGVGYYRALSSPWGVLVRLRRDAFIVGYYCPLHAGNQYEIQSATCCRCRERERKGSFSVGIDELGGASPFPV